MGPAPSVPVLIHTGGPRLLKDPEDKRIPDSALTDLRNDPTMTCPQLICLWVDGVQKPGSTKFLVHCVMGSPY